MKVAYRFILKSYVGPMVLTFFVVMFILLMHFLWMHIDDLVGKGLSAGVIAELVMYAAATLIPMGLPLATLLASIMTMGNLGENNELLALKAAGISLPRITRPLVIIMIVVSTGSFFVINNLTPYSYQKMFTLLSDISKQRQEMKFVDGIFFNGIPDMSIRVSKQHSGTNLLEDVLIYDNSQRNKMRTTVADSGYIKISNDKKYLEVTLYYGEVYEETRNYQWYNNNVLSHHIFNQQEMLIPISGFSMERSEVDLFKNNSQTKNMAELSVEIDSIRHSRDSLIENFTRKFIDDYAFKHWNIGNTLDSLPTFVTSKNIMYLVSSLNTDQRQLIYTTASNLATSAQNFVKYESRFPVYASDMLYRAQADYQKKLALPFSIMIFFLIGAALGAIIRKGGIGMPIVISVVFFVIYYIITITGEKFVKDGAMHPFIGTWLSSLVLFPIAIFLTIKSTNDSALFNRDVYVSKIKQVKSVLLKIYKRKQNSK